jgi:hypothetical protein
VAAGLATPPSAWSGPACCPCCSCRIACNVRRNALHRSEL